MKLEPVNIYYLREMIEMYKEEDDHIRWHAWKDIAVERNYINGKRSYDIFFWSEDKREGRAKEWMETYEGCLNYINNFGDDDELFERFQGGIVQIICNETAEVVHEEPIPQKQQKHLRR